MGFLGVYKAVYDYQPQGEGELELREGALLYILEKSVEDDWWKAKKKAERDDEDEPEGLVPNNYVEEAPAITHAKALYDYTRQTDEEVSFSEDAELVVYDTSDPDWTLVGVNGDFGFAPANYIEIQEGDTPAAPPSLPSPAVVEPSAPALPQRPVEVPAEEPDAPASTSSPIDTIQNPAAAAIANIIHKQHASPVESEPSRDIPPPQPQRPSYQPEDSYEREPSPPPPMLPQRPPSQQLSPPADRYSPPEPSPPPRPQYTAVKEQDSQGHVRESPPYNRIGQSTPRSPSGYHLYNINEMVEVMGKRKKMPTTLGVNIATGTIFISPEGDGDMQEWTADRLTHYSIEGKHVFLDLVRPSKSIDFHAGAKDTAREIVSALGEISGAYRAEGLKEVIAAGAGGGGKKKGQILYDFMAQGDDEVTVAAGDEVVVLDDTKSEEWWMVRRMKNGKEGVVPSSYIEITGFVSSQPTGVESGLSTVERNRLEETRLAKEAMRKSRTDSIDSRTSEQHKKRDSKSANKPKPDPTKTRQWTDRTKSFTVEAQFIGLQDGKIHLHKTNGVKIAVPIPKMSIEDLEYVEKLTGVSLDEDKPLSDIRRRAQKSEPKSEANRPGASVGPEYDWFDFFLKAGVGPHQCERYAQNFIKDSMDEAILPDITSETLRTLGLKEGDILRVMRHLDNMFGRTGSKSKLRNVSFGGEEVISNGEPGSPGGLFSGPGGVLRNNTRKGRPAPAVQTGDVVDPKAFEQKEDAPNPQERTETPPASAAVEKPVQRGFDDDAWEVKQPKQPASSAPPSSSPPPATAPPATTQAPVQKQLTGAMADLSLLQAPLQPTPAQPAPAPTSQASQAPSAPAAIQPQPTAVPAPQMQPQQTGATPGFFNQVAQIAQQPMQTGPQTFSPQQTGFQQASRQRPQPPQNMAQSSLLPPPPQRPLSAPQNFPQQPNTFGPPPLQPQLTGLPQPGPQIAPPGQSLTELNQQRFNPSLQPQPTGFLPQGQFAGGLVPQPTGFQPQSQFGIQQLQQQQTGFQGLAPQPTGFGGYQPQPQQPMPTGINSILPPALQPQPTGMNGASSMPYTVTSPPPVPPIPQQPTAAPLQPQKTGPPPPVRFGVKHDAPKKLTPQPTGLRANLAQATVFLSYQFASDSAHLGSLSASLKEQLSTTLSQYLRKNNIITTSSVPPITHTEPIVLPLTDMAVPRAIRQVFLAIEQAEGAGARVRRSIGTPKLRNFSPFLMLDHFNVGRGAGFPDHPHRGQETITYLLSGGVDHEDFAGNKGTIGPGDLQFMTAGRGIMHAEMPRENPDGSPNVGMQLWVDLPKELKMCEPRYRDLRASEIPVAEVDDGRVTIKVISGQSHGVDSVRDLAYTPVWLLDVTIRPGGRISQPLPKGWNAFAYTLAGTAIFGSNDATRVVKEFHNVVFDQAGDYVEASVPDNAESESRFILVAGQPLDQKVVQYGPFVLTSQEEVYQAMLDYQTASNGFERVRGWESEIGKRMT
ncbi:hypothetical protein CNMCM6805_003459 [Aspergillus fumigatiaffinis]|uniref:Actin cytoskeleton-regulatory complex protein SLA1 n=1 Tax=Aspergillus fumigatiaffinis TaxID=340414 RepID=A0A8H4MFW0_9EURO|nr:hypothetical protein CNMCM6805_003459 [Aspergillus fumigatiaffinis]